MGLIGLIFKEINENENMKMKKKSWEPFRSCLLNSTANPANFHPNWDFFCFNGLISIYFFKYKTIDTNARAFLPLNISAVGSVYVSHCTFFKFFHGEITQISINQMSSPENKKCSP